MNRHADWLIEDLEELHAIHGDLTVRADVAGDHKLANMHRVRRDVYAIAIAKVRDALPRIIAEAREVEPDVAIVFGPLTSHALEEAEHAAALADLAARAETA